MKRTLLVVICLILFPPLGIVLMWTLKRGWSRNKKIVLTVAAAIWLAMGLGVGNDSNESDSNQLIETTTIQTEIESETNPVFDESKFTFYSSVNNDSTGKWRCAVCYTSKTFDEYALDYYDKYFQSGDEVHFVVNLELKTTSCVKQINNELDVSTYEYIDGEEHDAKKLATGTFLNEYYIDLQTGL